MNYSREYLSQRHRLSHQQIDRLLGENWNGEFIREKKKILGNVKNFIWITDLLRNHGFPFTCLKGPLLSLKLYNDPAVRLSHDLDFLVNPAQTAQIVDFLLTEGFDITEGFNWPAEKYRQQLLMKQLHHISLTHKQNGFCVEMHWTLEHEIPLNRKKLAGMVTDNLDEMVYTGRNFTVLNNEFCLLYLLIHGAKHGWMRFKWLVDILDYPYDKVNREAFQYLVKELHAERIVAQTNLLLKEYFNTETSFTAKKTRLPTILLSYPRLALSRPDPEPRTVKEIFTHARYCNRLTGQWLYKIPRFADVLLIRHGDITNNRLPYAFMYYFYRPYSFIKRRLFHG